MPSLSADVDRHYTYVSLYALYSLGLTGLPRRYPSAVKGLEKAACTEALSVHFPRFKDEPYFAECFSHMVEERHASEAVEVTQLILRVQPELLAEALRDAKTIAEALDGVWTQLDRIVQRATLGFASQEL